MTILFFLFTCIRCACEHNIHILWGIYLRHHRTHTEKIRDQHLFSEEIWVLIWWWWGFSFKPDAENIHINQMTPIKSNHYSMAHISFWFFFPLALFIFFPLSLSFVWRRVPVWHSWCYSPDGGHFPNFRCIFMHRNQMDKTHGFLHNIYCPFDENMEVLHICCEAFIHIHRIVMILSASLILFFHVDLHVVHLHFKHIHSTTTKNEWFYCSFLHVYV